MPTQKTIATEVSVILGLLNTNLTAVGLQLKKSLEETHGEGKEEMWGNFDVTVKEVSLEKPNIILKMICAG